MKRPVSFTRLRSLLLPVALLTLITLLHRSASATSYFWFATNNGTNWTAADGWSPSSPVSSNDSDVFINGSSIHTDLSYNITGNSFNIRSLTFGSRPSYSISGSGLSEEYLHIHEGGITATSNTQVRMTMGVVAIASQTWKGDLNLGAFKVVSGFPISGVDVLPNRILTLAPKAPGVGSHMQFSYLVGGSSAGTVDIIGGSTLKIAGRSTLITNAFGFQEGTSTGPWTGLIRIAGAGSELTMVTDQGIGNGSVELSNSGAFRFSTSIRLQNDIRVTDALGGIISVDSGVLGEVNSQLRPGAVPTTLTKTGAGQLTILREQLNSADLALVVQQGVVSLNAPAGSAANNFGGAWRGDLIIDPGTTVTLGADNQIDDARLIHVRGGTLDLTTKTEGTANELRLSSGMLRGSAGSQFNLIGTLRVGIHPTGTISTSLIDSTLASMNLFGGQRTFDIAASGVLGTELIIATPVTNGSILKQGNGTMTFTAPTSISGLTVSQGTVELQAAAGSVANNFGGAIFNGGVTIHSGATVRLKERDQISDNQTLHVNGGTFDMNGFQEGFSNQVQMTGGSIQNTPGSVTKLFISGGLRAASSPNTSSIHSAVVFHDNAFQTIEVEDGAAPTDLVISGRIESGSSLLKTGAGTLELSGTSEYNGQLLKASEGTIHFASRDSYFNVTLGIGDGTLAFSSTGNLLNSLLIEGNGAIEVRGAATEITHNGVVSNPVGTHLTVTKAGAGLLLMSGFDAFPAGISITGGDLRLSKQPGTPANNFGLIGGDVTVHAGARLIIAQSDQIDDTRRLHINGGTMVFFATAEGMATPIEMTGGSIISEFPTGQLNLVGGLKTHASAGTATIGSNVKLFGVQRTFEIGGRTLISGVISDGSVLKTGGATLELTGANTYSGLIADAGTVQVATDAALGAAGGAVTLNGSTLLAAGTFTLDATRAFTASNGASINVSDGHTLTVPQGIGEGVAGSSFSKAGLGTLALGGVSGFTGLFTIQAGTVLASSDKITGDIMNHGTLVFDQNMDGIYGGSLSGTGQFIKRGNGFVFLEGNTDNVGLRVTLEGGTLQLKKDSSPSVHALGGGTHTIQNGTTLRLDGTGGDQIFDGAEVIVNAGGFFDMQGRTETINQLAGAGQVGNSFGSATLSIGAEGGSSTFTGAISSITLQKLGTGTFTLGGSADNASLVALISAGTLVLEKASSAAVHALGGGTHTISTGSTLRLGGTGDDQIFDSAALTVDGTWDLGGRSETVERITGSGAITNGGTLTIGLSNTDSTISGAASDFTLVKNGSGTTTLAGITDNSGLSVNVNAGTLILDKASTNAVHALSTGPHSIAAGATLRIAGTGGDQIFDFATLHLAGTLDLNGRREVISVLSGSGLVTSSAGLGTLVLGFNNVSQITNTTLATNIALEKIGTGTLTLGGSSDNSGLTALVSAGTLVLDKASSATVHALGGGEHRVESGATLRLSGSGGDQIFNDSLLTLLGTLDMNGRSESIDRIGSSGQIVNNGGSATLTVGLIGGSSTFAGSIVQGGGIHLIKEGAGVFSLAGASNNADLNITVNAGTLELAKDSSLVTSAIGAGTHTIGAGGTLRLAGTGDNQISDAAQLLLNGTLDVNGRNETLNVINGTGRITGGGSLTLGVFNGTSVFSGIAEAVHLIKTGGGVLLLEGAADNANLISTVNFGTLRLGKTSSATVHALGGGTHTIGASSRLEIRGTGGDQIADDANVVLDGVMHLDGRSETVDRLSGTGRVEGVGGSLGLGSVNGSSTFDGQLSQVTLIKSGSGTLTLGGSQDNSGAVLQLNAGTVILAKASSASVHSIGGGTHSIAAGATLRLAGSGGDQIFDSDTLTNAGTFDLNGRSEFINVTTNAGRITSSSAGGILIMSSDSTLGGVLDSMTLQKTGSSSLTLSGTQDNTMLQSVVSSGTLTLAKTSSTTVHALGAGIHSVQAGGSLQLGGSGGDQIEDSATVQVNGSFFLDGRNEAFDQLTGSGSVSNSTGTSQLTLGGAGGSSTFSGSMGGGSGALTLVKSGSGIVTISGTTDNISLGAQVIGGTLVLAKSSTSLVHALGAATTVGSGAVLQLSGTGGDQIFDSVALTLNGTLDTNLRSETIGSLSGIGGRVIGGGRLVLTGSSAQTTDAITVEGAQVEMNGSFAGTLIASTGGQVSGRGSIGTLVADAGSTIAPGNSPGQLSSVHSSFAGFSTFDLELASATGVAGVDWDLLYSSDSLSFSASASAPVLLRLFGFGAGNMASNFDPLLDYAWTFMNAGNAINGFDADAWNIDVSHFSNPTAPYASWSVARSGNQLALLYTAVPEPSRALLLLLGITSPLLRRRRPIR
jgi:fibronectin-binding autotransporter adhesin